MVHLGHHRDIPALSALLALLLTQPREASLYGRISLEIYCVQEFLGPIAADAARGLGCGSLAVNLVQLAAVTLSAWLLHILTDRVLALTGRLKPRAKCAG